MPENVCALCVHLYEIKDSGDLLRRCPRCHQSLQSVHRETLTHLRQVQRRWQPREKTAASVRFRATVRMLPGAPWISPDGIEALSTILVNAVDRAARGQRDAGYACLLDGLQAAEMSAMKGALCCAALIRCYRELLDDYTIRYDLCRAAEEPREQPRLLAGLTLMELGEGVPADPDQPTEER